MKKLYTLKNSSSLKDAGTIFRTLPIVFLFLIISSFFYAQSFPCDGKLYFFRDKDGTAGGKYGISSLDNYTTNGATVVKDLCTFNTTDPRNALGANPVDGCLYFMQDMGTSNNLVKVDAACNETVVCTNLPFAALGCFDYLGRYWIIDDATNKMYAYKVNSATPCVPVKGPFNVSSWMTINIRDIAFNPLTCHFYAGDNANAYEIDTTGKITNTFAGGFKGSGGSAYGGISMGTDGKMYAYQNNASNATLYSFDVTTGKTVAVDVLSPGTSNYTDMASFPCRFITANFALPTPTCGLPITLSFIDKSIGTITSWIWDFGDPGSGAANNATYTTSTDPTHTYTLPGTYTITLTVKEKAACFVVTPSTITKVITIPSPPTITVPPATVCAGVPVTLTASGATTYTWSPGTGLSLTTGASVTANPGATTTYTVVGTTAGCTGKTTVAVTVDPKPTVTVPAASVCGGVSAPLTASGASTYTWTPSTGLSATTGASVTATPVSTITYTVIGASAAGCTGSTTVIVTVNPKPVVTVPPATICNGASTTLTASGATTYSWAPTTGLSNAAISNPVANPTITTTYTVIGTTAGCTGSVAVVVTVNPIPVVSVPAASICPGGSTPLTASGATTYTWSPSTGLSGTTGTTVTANPAASITYTVIGTSASCSGSTTVVVSVGALIANAGPDVPICSGTSTNLSASGGTVFSWTPATGLSNASISNPVANPTVTTTYTVVVSDGSCSDDDVVIVTVNPNPVISVPAATICANTSTTLTASGAATYTWAPAATLSAGTGTSVIATPATTTTYTITGYFATGCTGITTVVVTVNPVPVVTSGPAAICLGNATTLTAGGATTYSWSPAGSLNSSTGAAVSANPTVTTTYTIIGTSASGCTGSTTAVVTVNPPCGPGVSATGVTVCNGVCGTVTSTATGGNPPYTYLWNTGATTASLSPSPCPTVTTTYTITVTDNSSPVGTATAIAIITVNPNPVVAVPTATICAGASTILTATGATTYTWASAATLSAGTGTSVIATPSTTTTYTVTGSFATGCTGVTEVVVTVNPVPVVAVPSASICPGGSTVLTATGATTYTWSPGTGLNATTGASVTAGPTSTTTYTVIGTSLGCSASATATVTVGALVANAGPDKFICANGNVQLNATGGTLFTWTPATGLDNATIGTPLASPAVTTTYTVTVSDGFCSDDDEVVVTVNTPIVLNATGTNVTCYGACNGKTSVTTTGGISPYSYAWSSGCSTSTCNGICAGSYSLVTTDVKGCTASASTSITEPPVLAIVSAHTNVSCYGVCDGTASVSVTGGTSPYNYSWAALGGSASGAANLCYGSYACTVTDANNCTVKTSETIAQPNPINVISAGTNVCPNTCATLTASSTGGTGPIAFSWNPGALTGTSVSVCPTAATTYTVTGTDANCIGATTVVVIVDPAPNVTVPADTICQGNSTPLTASGANTYSWSPATGLNTTTGTTVLASPVVTTTYTVIGTSGNNCTASTEVVVTVYLAPVISSLPASICPGEDTTLTASGANTYTWSPASSLSASTGTFITARPTATTTYTIVGTGINGCSSNTTVIVTMHPKPVAAFTTGPDIVDTFNPTVYFNDQSKGININSWTWSLGDRDSSISTSQNPIFTYPDTAHSYSVKLVVTNVYGCIDSTIGIVYIKGIFTFYIPNTFTPNGDGTNDGFLARGVGIDETDYDLWIFDRWGNEIWHTGIWGEAWEGKANHGAAAAQIDTYVWKVHVREKENHVVHNYIGHVNIVR